MKIGSYEFSRPLVLAPMAGVTDTPDPCVQHGCGLRCLR